MQIQGYEFEKPYFLNGTNFNNVAAAYVIYTVLNGRTVWLDVGETDELGNRLSSHERRDCWVNNARGGELYVGVKQESSEFQRRNVEADLRNKLLPLCGER